MTYPTHVTRIKGRKLVTEPIEIPIEVRLKNIASATAAIAREVGLWDKAQALIEDVHGPNCGLCGERCTRSHRTDSNVHADCWRREKADE